MPRIYLPPAPEYDGTLEVEESGNGRSEVYFIPPEHRNESGKTDLDGGKYRARLMLIDGLEGSLSIFPINTTESVRNNGLLNPKYDKIERITIEIPDDCPPKLDSSVPFSVDEVMELLESLPPAFTKDYTYGLGLAFTYRFIVKAVESLSDCKEIKISSVNETGINTSSKMFNISKDDFEKLRLETDKIDRHTRNASNSFKEAKTYNILAERLGLPQVEPETGRHPYRKYLNAAAEGKAPLSDEERNEVLKTVNDHAKDIALKNPHKLAKLHRNIETVTLERLIERYRSMLDKNINEEAWQVFFDENQFVLNLVFGYPVIQIHDKAYLGGYNLSGTGGSFTDFLVKNSLTNNTAIIEIKTPKADLLNKKVYRSGVYTPSAELSGSINQVLDQKYKFQKEIVHIKGNSGVDNIESYSVHCSLIIGRMPTNNDQIKSFEIFRHNSRDVEIITFDELLEKLEILHRFLATEVSLNEPC